MSRFPAPLRFVAAGLLAVASASAQQADTVKMELLTLSFNGSPKELYYRNGKEVAEMKASQQGIGAPFLYSGPRVILFYDSPAALAPRQEGAPPPKPVLQAALPSREDRALLVFAFPSVEPRKPTVRVYGIGTGNMKEGDYRLFNFSGKPVYAIFDETRKATIAPRKDTLLSSAAWRDEIMDMEVKFGVLVDGKIREVYGSVWGHRPQRRMFVFVFDRPDPNRPLDIRMFYDVPAIKAPAVQTGAAE